MNALEGRLVEVDYTLEILAAPLLCSLAFRHHIRIRTEESLVVEVDHVVGVFGDPDFGFPGDVRDEGLHGAAVLEGGDEHEVSFGAGEQVFEFLAAPIIHRSGSDHGLDEQEPVLGFVVDDDIGNLGGGIQGDSERGQGF